MASNDKNNYQILGIDLGTNSIGWALLSTKNKKPCGIEAMGVRIFNEGLEGMQTDGRGQSRNVARRDARQVRRNLERRTRRLSKLAHILQNSGLLPKGDLSDNFKRHEFFTNLDKEIKPPHILRACALDEKLTSFELGRALYHLGQRRGFLSNRKTSPKKNEELGKVKKSISDLEDKMHETGSRTLGEYFSKINPHKERLRERYTSRKMYEDEFEKIWTTQKEFHKDLLTNEVKKKISDTMFNQRPLKSQKHLIGACELEENQKRAPISILSVQRFRYLQTINNLEVDGQKLSEEQRAKLKEALESEGDCTFAAARKLLGFARTNKFNLESGGEKKIIGNRTAAKLKEIFCEQWDSLTEENKDQIIEDMRSIVKNETLKKRAMHLWRLDENTATKLSELSLEDGYSAFSRKAIQKLLPFLEEGVSLQTAIKKLYPERFSREGRALEFLPPVKSENFTELRNPLVERALSELRKIVNTLTKKHGKPEIIRIELARDLRQSASQREKTWKRMRTKEKERIAAAAKIINETAITSPKRDDVLKFLLAEECGWHCPYTGKSISMSSLFGDHPQFDIEHIIPFDRSLDDSFINKTLCSADENRRVKKGKTPYEAYSKASNWEEIVDRVKKFSGDARLNKLSLFLLDKKGVEDYISSFTSRQLNDTRYASKKAKEYLGLFFGGINDDGVDKKGTRRVQATTGQITAYLRSAWGLNSILGDGPGKTRDDHRHHAVDALTIALTEHLTVKNLNDAAKCAYTEGRRLFGKVIQPWETFHSDVRSMIENITVSPRVSRRVRGKLHAETFYSPKGINENGKQYVHIRKSLANLTKNDLADIVDDSIRIIVKNRLEELGGGEPQKIFAARENLPFIDTKDGRRNIRSVRIKQNLATFPIGEGNRVRHVVTDSNHHMEIVGISDEDGKIIKWGGHVVSLPEAYRRLRSKEPVIKRDHGANEKFLFSLSNGEVIKLDDQDGSPQLYVLKIVPQSKQVVFVALNDARVQKNIPKQGRTAYPETLRKRNCCKLVITPLGEVRNAND